MSRPKGAACPTWKSPTGYGPAEYRIRGLKDTGATNLPLRAFDENQLWLEIAQLAYEFLTWTQLLSRAEHPARVWEHTSPALIEAQTCGGVVRGLGRAQLE